MNALTLRGIVAEELGSLRLHVVGKCGVLGELREERGHEVLAASGVDDHRTGVGRRGRRIAGGRLGGAGATAAGGQHEGGGQQGRGDDGADVPEVPLSRLGEP